MLWIVLTDASMCRIYSYDRPTRQLMFVKQLEHPASKLRDIELTSDKPGHYQGDGRGHGSFVQRTDPHENEKNQFAKIVADELDAGRNHNQYKKLILIALPTMLGLLGKHLNKQVNALIANKIEKDYLHFKEAELHKFLQDQLPAINK